TKEEFLNGAEVFTKKIEGGSIFIHPTDTIYGIGCDATNSEAVKKVREAKQRKDMPFSVIAPSKKWIYDNCEVSEDAVKWVEKLPGPYTLILKLRSKSAVAKEVNLGAETLGVRIPESWFAEFVEKLGLPVVSTSANVSGEDYMTSTDDLDDRIKPKLDFVVYEGEKTGRPSTIVKLFEEKIEVTER
ncbi:threonylcarbamoyl-AMP synthase, partial [Candidatus Woesearchaeota archaeon]|nr:threonylcarbamoyl-AMP synthase [Candidatus Woesearchaeota archaeon]